ncbi:MAG: hypothetical protein ACC655_10800 [Rhodothermia bacterium]
MSESQALQIKRLTGIDPTGFTHSISIVTEEALDNVREAISLYLESLESNGDPVPPPITEEIVEVEIG